MKNLILCLTAVALLAGASGCKKDFLEKNPPDQINDANFYQTAQDAISAINASYAPLQWPKLYNIRMWATDIIAGNSVVGAGGGNDGIETVQLSNFTIQSDNAGVLDAWKGPGVGVLRANAVLENIPGMSIDEGLKNRILGEAHFLRGLYWFIWTRFFGDIPLLTKQPRPGEDLDYPRTSQSQVYAAIIEDLKTATGLLPTNDQYSGLDRGRATKGAAVALLSKVYLQMGDYANAAVYSKQVIDGAVGSYSLNMNYEDNFDPGLENGPESIFEVQYANGSGINSFDDLFQGSWASEFMAPRGSGLTPNGGYGWNQPVQEFVDQYEAKDKRKAVTIFSDGDKTKFDPGFTYLSSFSSTGYNVKKFLTGKENLVQQDSPLNFPVMRYSDVLLIYAEAKNALGATGEAETYLNMVRTRAGLDPISGLSPADFQTALLKERRLEFAFEGVWYFDVLRQGVDYATKYFHDRGKTNFSAKHMLFPVPQAEIDIDPKLTQNPGY